MQGEQQENFFVELLKFFLIAVVIVIPIRLWVAQPFIVSGASMEPTFDTGQYLIIDELSYDFSAPQRGDVVIFRYPLNTSEFFIKRIIGLPGETVTIQDGKVLITDTKGTTRLLPEPYIANQGNGGPQSTTLTNDQYFVMGDNRPDSSDSRIWGPVPRSDIVGRALVRLLPVEKLGTSPGEFHSVLGAVTDTTTPPTATASSASIPAAVRTH